MVDIQYTYVLYFTLDRYSGFFTEQNQSYFDPKLAAVRIAYKAISKVNSMSSLSRPEVIPKLFC